MTAGDTPPSLVTALRHRYERHHDDAYLLGRGRPALDRGALQVLTRVRASFQVELPLRATFEASTVAGPARLVDEAIPRELGEMSDDEFESALAKRGGALELAGKREDD